MTSHAVTWDDIETLGTRTGWQGAFARLDRAGAECIDLVLRGVEHADRNVRKWCVALMDHHGDDRCVAALLRALHDPSPDVRRHAVHSLGCQTCKGQALKVDVVKALIDRAVNDQSVRVRRCAAHMLGNQPFDTRAKAVLENLARNATDAKLRTNAAWGASQHVASATVSTCKPK